VKGEDGQNRDGKRPEKLEITLYEQCGSGSPVVSRDEKGNTRTITLQGGKTDSKWTGTFTNLPTHKNGQEITYTVKEDEEAVRSSGYNTETGYPKYENNGTDHVTITNKREPETVKITIQKIWEDNNNQDGKRPESIFLRFNEKYDDQIPDDAIVFDVRISSSNQPSSTPWDEIEWVGIDSWGYDGTPVEPVELKGTGNTWSFTTGELFKYASAENGIKRFNVKELNKPDGYSVEYDFDQNAYIYKVINKKNPEDQPELRQIPVTKIWNDNDDQDGKRPKSITVKLLAGGEDTGETLTLNSGNDWKGTFTDLSKYENNRQITYTIEEVSVEGYETSITGNMATGYTITNTRISENVQIDIPVTKRWVDNNNVDGLRPESITVKLYADGKDTGETLTLGPDNWTGTFTNLNKYENGRQIAYTIQEVIGDKYNKSISGNVSSGFTIINNLIEEKIKIPVTKVWNDNNDEDGIRPESITVKLYANGKDTGKTLTLKSGNGWSGTFENLNQSENGNPITYTIKEVSVDGYQTTISGDATSGFTIKNTHTVEKIQIPVTKVWNDNNNQDGIRPASITVRLLADGKATDKTLGLGPNNWSGTFTNLNKYENGRQIAYTIQEEGVDKDDYQTTIRGNATTGFTVTNTHTPENIEIKINKSWADDDNRDGIRPLKVQFTLYAGEVQKQTINLSETNGWTQTISGLPKCANGKDINYSIKESTINGYNVSIQKTQTSNKLITFTVTNTHVPEKIEIPITKIWNDESDRDGKRPESITVKLWADKGTANEKLVQTTTIKGNGDNWSYTFRSTEREPIYKYRHTKVPINYTIEEVSINDYESPEIDGNQTRGFTITNKHVPERVNIEVIKKWDDDLNGKSNFDEYRPNELEITLLSNEKATNSTKMTGTGDQWTYTFENLYRYENGQEIQYSVEEKIDHIKTLVNQDNAYNASYEEPRITEASDNTPAKITLVINNEHEPNYEGYIVITGKVWEDALIGKGNDTNGIFGEEDSLLKGIEVRLKGDSPINASYYSGTEGNAGFEYCGTDYAVTANDGTYTIKVGYDESPDVYKLYKGYGSIEEAKEKLQTAYVEFNYDGMTYTTVKTSTAGENTSKAVEKEETRNIFDSAHSEVIPSTKHPDEWQDKNITAITKGVITFNQDYMNLANGYVYKSDRTEVLKYGNGISYKRTNPDGAWNKLVDGTINELKGKNGPIETHKVDVIVLPNINLGLFKREQPDVSIIEEISKVEVIINSQQYTYLYNIKAKDIEEQAQAAYQQAYEEAIQNGLNNEEAEQYAKTKKIEAKFQNKGTYLYRRPVNPADITYMDKVFGEHIKVYVTYQVILGNSSPTLPITVHQIRNYYDKNYTLKTPGLTTNTNGADFNEAIYDEDIEVQPLTEKPVIELRYEVNSDAIIGLFNNQAPLNNAVEIEAYSTKYGVETLYAEQRTGGRTNQPYGGYDYDSHPGNAGIYLDGGRLVAQILEDDTDFAPAFVLCESEEAKTLAGTIWEDRDEDNGNGPDNERLGDGQDDGDAEKKVDNVKIELYNLDGTLATLYDDSGNEKPAVDYSENGGNYAFEGVVTGEYFVKYTYGDNEEELKITELDISIGATTMDGTTEVNARNYKSTIITDDKIASIMKKDYTAFSDDEKKWHITHEDGYSVAVDNMLDRLSIEDLVYENFKTVDMDTEIDWNHVNIAPVNMTAYTKPFATQVEFEPNGSSQVNSDGKIDGISSTLDKLDFGIIERPRENLFIQKTATYVKVTLANGQVLTEGDPREGKVKYVKYMDPTVSGKTTNDYAEKELLIEMDEELIQGAQLEVKFEVKVTNHNEIDYDYGDKEHYEDEIKSDIVEGYCDQYIAKDNKADYYFYGINSLNKEPLATKVKFIDYMKDGLIYNKEEVETKWNILGYEEINHPIVRLHNQIPDDLKNEEYNIFELKDNEVVIEQNSTTEPIEMNFTKLLTVKEENSYDVSAEIYSIDAKTARTIKESEEGTQMLKTYQPGNYTPAYNIANQQDDDRIDITVTPPTGIMDYIIHYATVGLGGLVAIAVVIIFIKKKVLTK